LEFADLLKKRRMVRRFSTDPVPKDASSGLRERPSARQVLASARVSVC